MNDDSPTFTIGAIPFRCVLPEPGPGPGFPVYKSRAMVDRYVDMVDALQPARIVELGIRWGGSTVMLAEMACPSRLVAVDLDAKPVALLDQYIADSGRPVTAYYGFDQADREGLVEVHRVDFADEPLDLVVDDASHLYGPSLASFETLFPLVRPGGLYIVEDWRGQHVVAETIAAAIANPRPEQRSVVDAFVAEHGTTVRSDEPPLSKLALQLVLARASASEAVADVQVDEDWLTVRRGAAPLDPATFRVADIAPDVFGQLAKP